VAVAVALAVAEAVAVAVGVGESAGPLTHCENSEDLIGLPPPSNLVAVAATALWPVGSGNIMGPKLALQLPFVITFVEPRKACPSPKPDGSQTTLEKNSSRKFVLATLSKVPERVTMPPPKEADVITGKFCGSLASQASLGVAPVNKRSIPKPPLEWIELPRIAHGGAF
jgi:hypothetical protein